VVVTGRVIIAAALSVLLGAASQRPIDELKPQVIIHLGKTADWVAVTKDAVWVGSTGPFAVHRIDPKTNKLIKTVELPGEPCAGLAAGLQHLWVPLCTTPPSLARVDLKTAQLTILNIGPAAEEGGIAVSADSVWMVTDKDGTLARITKEGEIKQTVKLPKGSYNPLHADGKIWITRADGAEISRIDAKTGAVEETIKTGPGPRFLAAGEGAIWTLNQGDGSLTRIKTREAQNIALGLSCTDAKTATTKVQWTGPGGDSLGVSDDAIWLTDYHGGTISRLDLKQALKRCRP
jgi:virginiamycin B lyase